MAALIRRSPHNRPRRHCCRVTSAVPRYRPRCLFAYLAPADHYGRPSWRHLVLLLHQGELLTGRPAACGLGRQPTSHCLSTHCCSAIFNQFLSRSRSSSPGPAPSTSAVLSTRQTATAAMPSTSRPMVTRSITGCEQWERSSSEPPRILALAQDISSGCLSIPMGVPPYSLTDGI